MYPEADLHYSYCIPTQFGPLMGQERPRGGVGHASDVQ